MIVPDAVAHGLAIVFIAFAAGGCAYALLAAPPGRRVVGEGASAALAFPSITILKPLRGAEPALHGRLASFCDQDYPRPGQNLFGGEERGAPAVAGCGS